MTPLYLTTFYFRPYAQEILKQYKKTRCELTGSNQRLTVHHIISYKQLLIQAFELAGVPYRRKIADVTLEDREKVIAALHKVHSKDIVITITKDIHDQYHKKFKIVNEETWATYLAFRKREQLKHLKGAKRK